MSGSARTKRTTDLLDDTARARIIGGADYVGGGSQHSGEAFDDFSASNLSEHLFFGFDEEREGDDDDDDSSPSLAFGDFDSDLDSDHDRAATHESYDARAADLIRSIGRDQRDAFRNVLTAHVSRAVEMFDPRVKSADRQKTIIRRNVMAYLRSVGYNAGICRVTWQKSGGLNAGNHEFIDVVARCADRVTIRRYLIELHFASEFEIARPTPSYARLVQHVPRVFVGTCEELKQILKVVSDALKVSMKSRGLLLPPWRKHRFVQMKWFGSYRRTVNVFHHEMASSSYDAVKCRSVGFDVGGCLLTARTR